MARSPLRCGQGGRALPLAQQRSKAGDAHLFPRKKIDTLSTGSYSRSSPCCSIGTAFSLVARIAQPRRSPSSLGSRWHDGWEGHREHGNTCAIKEPPRPPSCQGAGIHMIHHHFFVDILVVFHPPCPDLCCFSIGTRGVPPAFLQAVAHLR